MDRNKKEKRRSGPTASRELDFPAVLSLPDGSSRGCHKNTASEIGLIRKKTMQQVQVVMPIENLYVRAITRTRAGNDVGKPIAVHITRGHSNAAGEGLIKRKETQQDRVRGPVKDFHVRSAAWTGGGNDIGEPISVNVAGGHSHAAREKRRVGKETTKRVTCGAVEHTHYWQSTAISADDDVGLTVAIDVAGSYIYTAAIKARERQEAANKIAAYSVKHSHMRPHSGAGSGDNVSKAVAVDIANSDTNAAGKTSSIGRKGKRIIPGLAVNCDLLHVGCLACVRANGQNR